jgi:SAM-dependent methyltransferase
MNDRKRYFDAMYSDNADPYAVRTRWYEMRKRAVLLASLPRHRYARVFEPGCGSAELTLQLAERSDSLLCSDFSEPAVSAARQRTAALANVRVEQQSLPTDWPVAEAPFDLIVISEIGYFLDADVIEEVARRCAESLAADGTLVACDWRPDFEERALSTEAVHAALAGIGLPRIVRHEEADFLLQVWSRDARSVAQQEGIR